MALAFPGRDCIGREATNGDNFEFFLRVVDDKDSDCIRTIRCSVISEVHRAPAYVEADGSVHPIKELD